MLLNNEIARLRELQTLDILDSEPEWIFDSIVELTKETFGVPVVLVSLVDQNRQWFKACYGTDIQQMPRDISFCTHTIQSHQTMVIPDATQDERFKNNPLVTGELMNIRFYAGSPLITPDGSAIGTLCAIDDKPHAPLNDDQIRKLEMLARITMERIYLRYNFRAAQKEVKDKSEFVSHLSHEIRTPLNVIMGATQLMDQIGTLNEQQQKVYEALKMASSSLGELINDHLDLSQLENGKMTMKQEVVNLHALLSDVQTLLKQQAEQKKLKLVVDLDGIKNVMGVGDSIRLRQIMVNLVGNAIKYTPAGEVKITAKVNVANANDRRFVVDVTDTGVGIPEDSLDKIFCVYERAVDKQNIVAKGTGLGLAITKRLVDLMGGQIDVTSKQGEGSTFTVNLPLAA